uniref:Uncharacterized protein n=1 Tax=Rhipicephalus appendiculatus TaxID=34631 RepID=A0A131YEE8_RHIAP
MITRHIPVPFVSYMMTCILIVDVVSGISPSSLFSIACYTSSGVYMSIIEEIILLRNRQDKFFSRELQPFKLGQCFFLFFSCTDILDAAEIMARLKKYVKQKEKIY